MGTPRHRARRVTPPTTRTATPWRRHPARVLLCLGLLTAGGCAQLPNAAGNDISPVNGHRVRPDTEPVTPPPVGSCMSSEPFRAVDCAQPHNVEVAAVQTLPDPAGAPFPGGDRLSDLAIPRCRAALPDYLGSRDFDATRLQSWVFWPSPDGWDRGERWLLCSAIEIGADGGSKRRTGTLRGVLRAGGPLGGGTRDYQTCTSGSPTHDVRLRPVTCDQPHVAEAIPDVLSLGGPPDRPPSRERMNAAARQHCRKALAGYLDNNSRTDVTATWRLPTPQSWNQGYTNIVCYAETRTPITGRLAGIGTRALPR